MRRCRSTGAGINTVALSVGGGAAKAPAAAAAAVGGGNDKFLRGSADDRRPSATSLFGATTT